MIGVNSFVISKSDATRRTLMVLEINGNNAFCRPAGRLTKKNGPRVYALSDLEEVTISGPMGVIIK